MEKEYKLLVDAARAARKNAYCPYSKFRVGAAVLTKAGKIYTGVNVENGSYGLTMCAERVAVGNAVAHGEKKFAAVAIVFGGKRGAVPCGACLQVIAEFGNGIDVVMANNAGTYTVHKVAGLLPVQFHMNGRGK